MASVVTLATPVRFSIYNSPNKISVELTCNDNRKNPQRLLDDCIQVRQILSLQEGDRIMFGGKVRVKLGTQMFQSCAIVK